MIAELNSGWLTKYHLKDWAGELCPVLKNLKILLLKSENHPLKWDRKDKIKITKSLIVREFLSIANPKLRKLLEKA